MGGINVDTTKELPTVIAFCAGYGGIERGLDLAGIEHRVIAYVEIEAYCVANLVAKMEAGRQSESGGDISSQLANRNGCLLYTSPSPRDRQKSRMPSSA